MHIYYYKKDNYYYVMNENGILEKYSVTNNIDMILKKENLINYFTKELNEEENKFRFKTIQELDYNEKLNLYQLLEPIILTEYIILKDNVIPSFIAQFSIINIINTIYYNRKKSLQTGDKLLGDILTELLVQLKTDLESIKQISHYKKEIVSLSEFDPNEPKKYVENIDNLINSYKDDNEIKLSLELDPEYIFLNNEYNDMLESGDYEKDELEYQRKIKKIKDTYLQEIPKEVEEKLTYIITEENKNRYFLLTNGFTTIMMIGQIFFNHIDSNNEFYKAHIITIAINIIYYYQYYKKQKELEHLSNPILKLEKKDK